MLEAESKEFVLLGVEEEDWENGVAVGGLELLLLVPVVHPHPHEALVVAPPLAQGNGPVLRRRKRLRVVRAVLEVKVRSSTFRLEG